MQHQPIIAAKSNDVLRAEEIASTWHKKADAGNFVTALLGVHQLCLTLPVKARAHIGNIEGRYVKVGLAHGRDYRLTATGGAALLIWEELESLRADALRCAERYSPYTYASDQWFEFSASLDDLALEVRSVVGEALAAQEQAA